MTKVPRISIPSNFLHGEWEETVHPRYNVVWEEDIVQTLGNNLKCEPGKTVTNDMKYA